MWPYGHGIGLCFSRHPIHLIVSWRTAVESRRRERIWGTGRSIRHRRPGPLGFPGHPRCYGLDGGCQEARQTVYFPSVSNLWYAIVMLVLSMHLGMRPTITSSIMPNCGCWWVCCSVCQSSCKCSARFQCPNAERAMLRWQLAVGRRGTRMRGIAGTATPHPELRRFRPRNAWLPP